MLLLKTLLGPTSCVNERINTILHALPPAQPLAQALLFMKSINPLSIQDQM